MPANLSPAYFEAEQKYKEATTPRDKLKGLRGMLSAIPKHKGTEKLQADLKRRIAQLTREEERGRKKGGRGPGVDHVPREGAGQVVLVGEPNAGKSALFGALTHAHAEVAPYPFTTLKPQPGMVHFEDVQIQLVDSPPYSDEFQEAWLPNVARFGHALLLVVDLSHDEPPGEQLARLLRRLERVDLKAVPEETAPEDLGEGEWVKRALWVGNKCEAVARAPVRCSGFPLIPVSTKTGEGLDRIPPMLFRILRILRVYSKLPGKKPDLDRPFILPAGATVGDMCRLVHKDFQSKLRFARHWREGAFQGIQIHGDHILLDKDVVELHL